MKPDLGMSDKERNEIADEMYLSGGMRLAASDSLVGIKP